MNSKTVSENKKAKRSPIAALKNSFRDFWRTVRKVRIPTVKEWWHSFWRVVLIVVIFAVLLSIVDYGLVQGTFRLQGILPAIVENETLSYWYLGALIFSGLLSAVGVLFQEGSSDGLTSMLGSGSQYQGSIAGAVKKISKFTLIVGIIFLLLCLFSPMFLGGLY